MDFVAPTVYLEEPFHSSRAAKTNTNIACLIKGQFKTINTKLYNPYLSKAYGPGVYMRKQETLSCLEY